MPGMLPAAPPSLASAKHTMSCPSRTAPVANSPQIAAPYFGTRKPDTSGLIVLRSSNEEMRAAKPDSLVPRLRLIGPRT